MEAARPHFWGSPAPTIASSRRSAWSANRKLQGEARRPLLRWLNRDHGNKSGHLCLMRRRQLCFLKRVLSLIKINEVSKDMVQSICGGPSLIS